MRSAAAAIAWEFRRQHRWGLIALTGYMLVLGAIKIAIVVLGLSVTLGSEGRFAAVVSVPLTTAFVYLVAVFCYGFHGDLAARRSTYPARMFTLPVTTAALAALPMLYGSMVVVIFWLGTRVIAIWPPGWDVPVIWPALLAAALLAWAQALTWMPYPFTGLRVIVSVLWLTSIDAVVLLALHFKVSEPVMAAFLAPQLPLAYLVARVALARARRGDTPDWRDLVGRRAQLAGALPDRRAGFASADRAQAWFEWRQRGWSLPVLVALVLPFELALLFLARNAAALIFTILLFALLTPAFMAGFTAATGGKGSLTPFQATRPLSSAALVAAKLQAAAWSTLAAWLVVLVAVPLALVWSNTWPLVSDRAKQFVDAVGTPRAIAALLLAVAGFMASTWKQLVQSLYVGLSGREWLVRSSVVLRLTILCLVAPLAIWVDDSPAARSALWNGFPSILAALACIKLAIAARVAVRIHDSRVLSDRTLIAGAAGWCAAVFALYGLLGWLVSGPLVPRYFLVIVAILAIPLTRVSAAPLALARNRHG